MLTLSGKFMRVLSLDYGGSILIECTGLKDDQTSIEHGRYCVVRTQHRFAFCTPMRSGSFLVKPHDATVQLGGVEADLQKRQTASSSSVARLDGSAQVFVLCAVSNIRSATTPLDVPGFIRGLPGTVKSNMRKRGFKDGLPVHFVSFGDLLRGFTNARMHDSAEHETHMWSYVGEFMCDLGFEAMRYVWPSTVQQLTAAEASVVAAGGATHWLDVCADWVGPGTVRTILRPQIDHWSTRIKIRAGTTHNTVFQLPDDVDAKHVVLVDAEKRHATFARDRSCETFLAARLTSENTTLYQVGGHEAYLAARCVGTGLVVAPDVEAAHHAALAGLSAHDADNWCANAQVEPPNPDTVLTVVDAHRFGVQRLAMVVQARPWSRLILVGALTRGGSARSWDRGVPFRDLWWSGKFPRHTINGGWTNGLVAAHVMRTLAGSMVPVEIPCTVTESSVGPTLVSKPVVSEAVGDWVAFPSLGSVRHVTSWHLVWAPGVAPHSQKLHVPWRVGHLTPVATGVDHRQCCYLGDRDLFCVANHPDCVTADTIHLDQLATMSTVPVVSEATLQVTPETHRGDVLTALQMVRDRLYVHEAGSTIAEALLRPKPPGVWTDFRSVLATECTDEYPPAYPAAWPEANTTGHVTLGLVSGETDVGDGTVRAGTLRNELRHLDGVTIDVPEQNTFSVEPVQASVEPRIFCPDDLRCAADLSVYEVNTHVQARLLALLDVVPNSGAQLNGDDVAGAARTYPPEEWRMDAFTVLRGADHITGRMRESVVVGLLAAAARHTSAESWLVAAERALCAQRYGAAPAATHAVAVQTFLASLGALDPADASPLMVHMRQLHCEFERFTCEAIRDPDGCEIASAPTNALCPE